MIWIALIALVALFFLGFVLAGILIACLVARERMARTMADRDAALIASFGEAIRRTLGYPEPGTPTAPAPATSSPQTDPWYGVPVGIQPPWERVEEQPPSYTPVDNEAAIRAMEVELALLREGGTRVPPGEAPGEGPDGI